MQDAGGTLRLDSNGGMNAGGAYPHRRGAAIATAIAALLLPAALLASACASPGYSPHVRATAAAAFRVSTDAGLSLYESGEFLLAARRFREASERAVVMGDREAQKTAVAAECMSWLRARRLGQLSECSQRLEHLQRRTRRSDPGVNTLIAFGAIAGQRPLPPLRIPTTVRPLVQASAGEVRR